MMINDREDVLLEEGLVLCEAVVVHQRHCQPSANVTLSAAGDARTHLSAWLSCARGSSGA